MILLQRFFSKCTFIAIFLFTIGCQAKMSDSKNDVNGKVYFASFSGYSIPLKLVDEITEDEAVSRDSYYVATYEKGVLLGVEKYFQGSLFFKHEYFYYDDGTLKEKRGINVDGKETINLFDEKGKMIKTD